MSRKHFILILGLFFIEILQFLLSTGIELEIGKYQELLLPGDHYYREY